MDQTDVLSPPLRAVREWQLPRGRWLSLPDGGRTFLREIAGPADATPVVLLHGIATTGGLMWFAAMSQLGAQFRCLVPDMRGHGRSRCDGRFRLTDAADDVVGMLDVLGLERAILLGYSLGGTVAQLVARRHPERLAGLVLSATASRFGPTGVARLPMTAAGRVSAAVAALPLRRAWFRPLADEADSGGGPWAWFASEMRGCHPQTILEAGGELERFNSQPWLPDLDLPSAVVVTRRDKVVPPESQRLLGRLIPGARTLEIDAGHVAAGMAPEMFGPAALEACRWVDQRSRVARVTTA